MSVSVNSVEIPEPAILAEMQYHPAPSAEAARYAAAQALVVRELLLQRADTLGLAAERTAATHGRADDEDRIRSVIDTEVTIPEADEATCRRYYANNRTSFCSPDLYEGAHILFSAPPEDINARSAAKAKAEQVITELADHPDRFAGLARNLSDCTSGLNGGSLGQIARGDAVPEFETFLFNLEDGQLCPVPVETRYGFHVVRLDRKIAGQDLPFEAARANIETHLTERSWCIAVRQYLRLLAGAAKIEGIDIDAETAPLIQ